MYAQALSCVCYDLSVRILYSHFDEYDLSFEGFGDSEAGNILQQFPELEEVFTIITKVGEGRK